MIEEIHLCANHVNGDKVPRCTAPALPGLDYCTPHLNHQETYCPIRHCTRPPVDELHLCCVTHQGEWEFSGLTLLEWAATRYNAAAISLAAAKKVHGGK